jgi:hypothetical protein
MMNWPGTPSNIPSLSYSNGVFTNNTNLTRVYTLDYQGLINTNGASGGRILEADLWVVVNTGSSPASGFQRRGQATYLEQGGGVQASFVTGSATVTIQPGGTFGVGTWASIIGGGTYFNGGPLGSSFLSGQSTRLTVTEVTNFSPLYQAGCIQNTQTVTAYTANTPTLLTFPLQILDTNDSLVPDTVSGVRVWKNTSTYARTYIVDYTANIDTTNNIGLAAIWLQKNSTTSQPTGRFAMQSFVDILASNALLSNTSVITLQPNEYVTAWFLCDQSGSIGVSGFGNDAGQGTRITITDVSDINEGFNQFPYQYGVFYSSNNVSQVVPALTFTQIPVNNVVFGSSINATLIPLTNNLDGSWTCTQSGLYTFASEIQIDEILAASVVTMYIQTGTTKINSSIYVPAAYAPYSLNVTGTSFVQAGDEITLVLFREGATTVQNASLSITAALQG